ncbi:aldehyde dehydrogenase family protein [Nonomuraea basaltis]|uniref:aldehyde dehydrogenase family protein n=1 Tax=Nonomuraea basaltis TaxID=2495887 RepID=UPI0023F5302F|nr:aldehyde dehydrogenase family protein [Nonomuraea basaltis]
MRGRTSAPRAPGRSSLAARRSDLRNLKAALIARRGAIEEAINTDFGHRSRHETALMEVGGVVQGIDYLERNLRRFMRPTRRHTTLMLRFGSNRVEYQPLGVVGVISPWNYPVNLSMMPVVTAIAAGNRVMLKPSLRRARRLYAAEAESDPHYRAHFARLDGDLARLYISLGWTKEALALDRDDEDPPPVPLPPTSPPAAPDPLLGGRRRPGGRLLPPAT